MSNSKSLQLVKIADFEGIRFDCYQDIGNNNDEWYGTREQIGMMLEYEEANKAIAKIHERNMERLAKFSTIVKLTNVEGNRTVTRKVAVYSFKGLLEICRYSNQPRANAVMDFLWEVADSIRQHGAYITPQKLEEINRNSEAMKILIDELGTKQKKINELESQIEALSEENTCYDTVLSLIKRHDTMLFGDFTRIQREGNLLLVWLGENRVVVGYSPEGNWQSEPTEGTSLIRI